MKRCLDSLAVQVSDSYQHVTENQAHDAVAWDAVNSNEVGLSVSRETEREEDEDENKEEEMEGIAEEVGCLQV